MLRAVVLIVFGVAFLGIATVWVNKAVGQVRCDLKAHEEGRICGF